MNLINIGDRARDIVTGFEGIVMGHTSWFTGCDTYGLNPGLDKDGKIQDLQWFDSNRLQVVEVNAVPSPQPETQALAQKLKTGGPQPTPQRGHQ